MMKKAVFAISFLLAGATVFAQNCYWATSAGSASTEDGYGVATDVSGNAYVTGHFDGTSITFGSTTLTNAGMTDFYLVKYNSAGAVAWAIRNGGSLDDVGKCVTTDAAGNVYVAGYFGGSSITFGSTTLVNSNTGNMDLFVVKYDASGNVVWAKKAGGSSDEIPFGICIDGGGGVVVTGKFYSPTMTMAPYFVNNGGGSGTDFFIARWDANGTPKWIKGAGKNGQEIGQSVSSDGGANLFATGSFTSDTIRFGTNALVDSSAGNMNIFVVKYDTTGAVQYAKSAGENDDDMGYGIVADASGNAYVTGQWRSTSIVFGSSTFTNTGSYDVFVAKYDPSGNVLWARTATGSGDDFSRAITKDASGNVYVFGDYAGTTITFGSTTLTNGGSSNDLFITKYDSNGNLQSAISPHGNSFDFGYGIAAAGVDNLFVAGSTGSSSLIFGSTTLASAGGYDMFAAHIYNFTITIPIVSDVSCFGGNNGSATASVTGGYSPLTYLWNNSQTTLAASSLTAGTYTISVTDGNGCVHTASTTITQPPVLSSSIASQGVDCSLGQPGAATATISGGIMPYSYSWSNTQTTSTISNLSPGTYSLTVTDANGCTLNDSAIIPNAPAPVAPICMVTVDSLSQYNIVVWDKTPYTDVDSFIVYREIATNDYERIAAVSYDSLSQFIDTVRTLYFPNTGDPNAGTYRYKLQTRDSCGNYSLLSPYHNTIYITNSNGTFTWAQLYTIEGGPNPVSSYILMRDDFSTGNWLPVSSVAGTQQTVSDPNYATYQSTASWRVQTAWSITCTPTLRTAHGDEAMSLSTSYSNATSNAGPLGISNTPGQNVNLYPTSGDGNFTVETNGENEMRIEIYSASGQLVHAETIHQSKANLHLQAASGLYFVHVSTAQGTSVKKLIVQ